MNDLSRKKFHYQSQISDLAILMGDTNAIDRIEAILLTLKEHEVYVYKYETTSDVEAKLPYYTEQVYNFRRLQSSLVYWDIDQQQDRR
jgi:hypothetical protein